MTNQGYTLRNLIEAKFIKVKLLRVINAAQHGFQSREIMMGRTVKPPSEFFLAFFPDFDSIILKPRPRMMPIVDLAYAQANTVSL